MNTKREIEKRAFANTTLLGKKNEEIQRLQNKLKNQCTECPLNRRHDDEECIFLRRQAD